MRKFFIFSIIVFLSKLSFAQNYIKFIEQLPVDAIAVDSETVAYNQFWKRFLSVKSDSVIKEVRAIKSFSKTKSYNRNFRPGYFPPDTKPFFNRKLYLGSVLIVERQNSEANGVIGMTKCIEGKPFIYYDTRINKKISSEVIVFFREHEYAHFKLGHSGCGLSSDVLDRHKKELAADLEAAKTILAFKDGLRILDFVVATLSVMNENQDFYHPSSKERIDNLYKGLSEQVENSTLFNSH
jgi:hypothetical protein